MNLQFLQELYSGSTIPLGPLFKGQEPAQLTDAPELSGADPL